MQIPGTAAPGAYSQSSREMSFRSGAKRRCLFMSHVNPLNLFSCANRVGNAIERVPGKTVNPPNPCFYEDIHQQVRYCFLGHKSPLLRCVCLQTNHTSAALKDLPQMVRSRLRRNTTVKISTTAIPTTARSPALQRRTGMRFDPSGASYFSFLLEPHLRPEAEIDGALLTCTSFHF